MKLTTLTKAGATALLIGLGSTSFAHVTCPTTTTHYTAGYDYAPIPVVKYAPVTYVAPAVAPFRTFDPFRPGLVVVH